MSNKNVFRFTSSHNKPFSPRYTAVSYSLWRSFTPLAGMEDFHCNTKRGFEKARKDDPNVKPFLFLDNKAQTIGKLAQQFIFEFHKDSSRVSDPNFKEKIIKSLQLKEKDLEIQKKVLEIVELYFNKPILLDKKIIEIYKGDEKYPEPIVVEQGNYRFNLYYSFDCVTQGENDKELHIIDFKTGQSNFDRRQAYIYLLVAQSLYPQNNVTASFLNLETQDSSGNISISSDAMEAVKIELSLIAQRHQRQLKNYKKNPQDFYNIFTPNPGIACRYCPFTSICEHLVSEK